MADYSDVASKIPWGSRGPETVISQLGRSLLPVGELPFDTPPYNPTTPEIIVTSEDPNFTDYLMNIHGTAFQAAEGKLVTCWHVIESVIEAQKTGYVLARIPDANRGGSGKLNSWDRWIFRATAA